MENKVNPNTLTEDQVEEVLNSMNENLESSEDLKVLAAMPSNNGIDEAPSGLKGKEITINAVIDPMTGILKYTNEEPVEEKSNEDLSFDEMIEKASKNLEDEVVDISAEDITKQVKDEEMLGGLDLSDEDTLQILRVTNRVQNKEEFNIYRELPKSVQDAINKFLNVSPTAYSSDINSMRNALSELMIHDFITNISMEKFTMDYQKEFAALQNKMDEEISKMWMDYSENRTKYIEAAMDQETDPAKKEVIGAVLDSINDGFALNRIKLAAKGHHIRIKKFYLEKPRKVFDEMMSKYKNSSQNIYSIYDAYNILNRHMKDEIEDENDVLRFFIAICRYCMNYRVDNPVEHAFMYYAIYNAVLLDVYKGEEYTKFSTAYKKNVHDVIDLLKGKDIPLDDLIEVKPETEEETKE